MTHMCICMHVYTYVHAGIRQRGPQLRCKAARAKKKGTAAYVNVLYYNVLY